MHLSIQVCMTHRCNSRGKSIDSSYGYSRGSSMWSNKMQLLVPYVQNSSHNVDSGERRMLQYLEVVCCNLEYLIMTLAPLELMIILAYSTTRDTAFGMDFESKLLLSFRHCIVKLLKLEGSDWLFRQNDGADEDLIDRVAAREKFLYNAETRHINQVVHSGEPQYLSSERRYGSTLKRDEVKIFN
ncbi:hypothetical protein GQ457_06G019280 [Hibiscus cannabinus]